MQVTIPVPHPGAVINQDILTRLGTGGFFLGQSVFASLVEYMKPSNGMPGQSTIPTESTLPKYFSSLSRWGIFIDGTLLLDGPHAAAFSDLSFSIYSQRVAEFYRARTIAKDPEFRVIPRLVIREIPYHDRLNFSADVKYVSDELAKGRRREDVETELRRGRVVSSSEQPWSIGFLLPDETGPIVMVQGTETFVAAGTVDGVKYRASFPSNFILKYENGLPVAANYQEYEKAFPLTTVVTVGGGGAKGAASIKPGVNVRQSLLPAMLGMDDAALASAVLNLVEVK